MSTLLVVVMAGRLDTGRDLAGQIGTPGALIGTQR